MSGHDSIWVIIDRLTKSTHFLATRKDYSTERLEKLDIDEIVARHGVPVSIISDLDGWSPVLWAEIGESGLIGPSVIRVGTKGKLAPRYVGPFKILERIGPVAYRLILLEEFSSVHDTFHVSNLKKCLADANLHVPLDEIKINKTLHFVEEPVKIMDRKVRSLKRSKISLVKVHCNSKCGPSSLRSAKTISSLSILSYLLIVLLNRLVKSRDAISLRRGYCDTYDLNMLVIPLELAKCLYVLYVCAMWLYLCACYHSEMRVHLILNEFEMFDDYFYFVHV
ncbi:putative reverse transcriptase domain-containing protein [Tanacetum coccineum]